MTTKFDQMVITRPINQYTGLPEGDDAGYRDVPLSPHDSEEPDPLVRTSRMAIPINYMGRTPGVMRMYPGGFRMAPMQVAVRRPLELALKEADASLKPYRRKLVVLDGFRSIQTQAAAWAADRGDVIKLFGLKGELSVLDEVRVGLKADDNTSYAGVVRGLKFGVEVSHVIRDKFSELIAAAEVLKMDLGKVAELYVTFLANQGRNELELDESANTAHGNGGAVDLWMLNTETGRFVQFGAPYSYVNPPGTKVSPTVVNYFEMTNLEEYRAAVAADPNLQWYHQYHEVSEITQGVFDEAQRERRLMFHALRAVGCTYFSLETELGEFWHFNGGNERGGRQANVSGLDGSGNGCHARLIGKPLAAWTNQVGHRLARQMGLIK